MLSYFSRSFGEAERPVARRIRPAGTVLAFVLAICLAGWLPHTVQAQEAYPVFEIDAVTVQMERGAEESRLDLYTKIPYDNLTFITTGDGFAASFRFEAELYHVDDRGRRQDLAASRAWHGTARAPNFAVTQLDSAYAYTSQSVLLPPGDFLVRVRIEDEGSGQTFERELAVGIKDFRNKTVAVSDLLVLESFDAASQTITPSVSNRIEIDRPNFKLFYEVYARSSQEVRLSYEIYRARTGSGGSLVRSIFRPRQDDVRTAEMAFSNIEARQLRPGRNPGTITIPLHTLKVGDYVLRLTVEDESGIELDASEKGLSIQWMGVEEFILANLDDAVRQLRYVAKSRELEYIENAPNRDEKRMRFLEFWKKRDPTPATSRNERMEEYYHRVTHVNRSFGRSNEGWLTDRGEVYIRFGEPDDIERQAFRGQAASEVWHYNKIGRRFIFLEKSAGEYELLVPIWDERTRM